MSFNHLIADDVICASPGFNSRQGSFFWLFSWLHFGSVSIVMTLHPGHYSTEESNPISVHGVGESLISVSTWCRRVSIPPSITPIACFTAASNHKPQNLFSYDHVDNVIDDSRRTRKDTEEIGQWGQEDTRMRSLPLFFFCFFVSLFVSFSW